MINFLSATVAVDCVPTFQNQLRRFKGHLRRADRRSFAKSTHTFRCTPGSRRFFEERVTGAFVTPHAVYRPLNVPQQQAISPGVRRLQLSHHSTARSDKQQTVQGPRASNKQLHTMTRTQEAVIINKTGGTEVLEYVKDFPIPTRAPNQVCSTHMRSR